MNVLSTNTPEMKLFAPSRSFAELASPTANDDLLSARLSRPSGFSAEATAENIGDKKAALAAALKGDKKVDGGRQGLEKEFGPGNGVVDPSDERLQKKLSGIPGQATGETDVLALQKFLAEKGFDCGPAGADGKYGKDTNDALNRYLAQKQGGGADGKKADAKEEIPPAVSDDGREREQGPGRYATQGDNLAVASQSRSTDGKKRYSDTAVDAGDSTLLANTRLNADGTVRGHVGRTEDGVRLEQRARNANGSATTDLRMAGTDATSAVRIDDADGVANSTVRADQSGLSMVNPGKGGKGGKGDVQTQIPLGPQGMLESLGRSIDGWAPETLGQQTVSGNINASGVKSVQGTSSNDGSAHFEIQQGNGKTQQFDQSERGVFQDLGHTVAGWFN